MNRIKGKCKVCNKRTEKIIVCSDCGLSMCEDCNYFITTYPDEAPPIKENLCPHCHAFQCIECGEKLCKQHTERCGECGMLICADCSEDSLYDNIGGIVICVHCREKDRTGNINDFQKSFNNMLTRQHTLWPYPE